MTTMEIDKFINEVLKGLWPRWNPSDTELQEWQSRLCFYNFNRAKKAVADLHFTCSTRTIEPPNGKIIAALKRFAEINRTFVKKPANQVNEKPTGLTGQEAFDKAVADILNYPVGHKTRVWLEKYLEKTKFSKETIFDAAFKTVPAPVNANNERNRQQELLSKI